VAETATESASTDEAIGRLVDRTQAEGLSLTGPGGLLSELTKRVLESALEGEMDGHLGYARHDPAGRDGGNSCNGHRTKTVLTETGLVDIDVPRDRDSSFAPQIVRKRQSRLTGVDDLVISLSAKGLTHGEIAAHLAEVYGAEVSKQTITAITDRVVEDMVEWQNRPLDPKRFLAVVANPRVGSARRKSARTSCGVRSPRTRRGRSLSSAATRSRSARECTERLVRLGKY
jgi:transposase-like protein